MKKLLLFFCLILKILNTNAQNLDSNRTNIWYFGNGAGLDFSSGSPVAITNGALHTLEGCASICDLNGNLLMYTDGDTIWDKTHNPMPNGTGLLGCQLGSSMQGALIVPQVGNDSLLFVFTTDCWENSGEFGLRYSVVNIKLNAGLGDVIDSQKNILLYAPSTEGLTATYNCDKTGIWIASHEYNSNKFVIYLLDGNGLNPTPLFFSIGEVYYDYASNIRFSPNGKKIGSYGYGPSTAGLYDFDNFTGSLSNYLVVPNGGYGTCFSNDNSKLYFTISGNIISQFDLETNLSVLFTDTISDNATYGAINNTPDGKMIISSYYKDSISTIQFPNNQIADAGIDKFNIYLGGRQSALGGLTDFIQSYFNIEPDEECLINAIEEYDNEISFNIPNVFTPNGDGINDIFKISDVNKVSEFICKIYNRWGNQINEFSNKETGWNGKTAAGVLCNEGVYYYKLSIKRKGGKNQTAKGIVQLLN